MILRHGVRSLRRVGRDALESSDVHEGVIAMFVRQFCNLLNGRQLRGRIDEAFISAGDIIVHFNSVHAAAGPSDDLIALLGLSPYAPMRTSFIQARGFLSDCCADMDAADNREAATNVIVVMQAEAELFLHERAP